MEDKIEEEIEKKFEEHGKRIQSNTYVLLQLGLMMREEKVERELRSRERRKERHERDHKRRQEKLERDLKRLEGEQEKRERIEREQREIQEIEQSRKAEEEEDMQIYEEGLRRMDEFLEKIRQDLEDEKEKYDRSKEEVQSEIKETNESQEQEQQLEEFPRKTAANKTKQTIENAHTRKIEATTQLPIIYGDVKFRPCKQTNAIHQHLQEIERVNEKEYEEDIIYNISCAFKRKTKMWDRVRMKIEKVLLNKFWGSEECKVHYPLLEGKKNENCNSYEEHKAKRPENNQLKQLDSNITNNELCKRGKRWKWCQESDDASVRRKRRSLLKSSIRTP